MQDSSTNQPLRIAGAFAAFGVVWILTTDWIVARATRDPDLLSSIQTGKGWLFVLLSSALVYWLARTAQQEARHARARLERTFDSLEEAVFLVRGRVIVECNRAATEVLGYARDELLGADTRMLHVDDRSYREFGEAGLPELREKGVWHTEHRLRRKNGDILITDHTVSLLNPEEGVAGGVVSVIRDITERRRNADRMRRFYAHVQEAREEERKRIAREIHDELGQALTSLKMDLRRLEAESAGNGPDRIERMEGVLDETIRTVRRIATELRPAILDQLGLLPALEWLSEDFFHRYDIRCDFDCDAEALSMDETDAAHVFRVVQEALTNVARHADASGASLTVTVEDGLVRITVEDDGNGMETPRGGAPDRLGITGMQERANLLGGALDIDSAPGRGTRVSLIFPAPTEN